MSRSIRFITKFTFGFAVCMLVGGEYLSTAHAQSGRKAGSGSRSGGARAAGGARAGSVGGGGGSSYRGGSSNRGGSASKSPVETRGFAVVELFTSEGYRGFSKNDQQLKWIEQIGMSRNLPVYTLAFHVDRLNTDSFQDPFATSEASQRQSNYANAHARGSVTSPLMVINGEAKLPSTRKSSTEYINSALGGSPRIGASDLQLAAEVADKTVTVKWDYRGWDQQDRLNIALVQKTASHKVTSASGAERQVEHVNVVRDYKVVGGQNLIGSADGNGPSAELTLPADATPEGYHVISYVQNSSNGKIRAATVALLSDGGQGSGTKAGSGNKAGSASKPNGSAVKAGSGAKAGASALRANGGRPGQVGGRPGQVGGRPGQVGGRPGKIGGGVGQIGGLQQIQGGGLQGIGVPGGAKGSAKK